MVLNIRNTKVEQLAAELAQITGESTTSAILRALETRRASRKRRLAQVVDFLENEIWPHVRRGLLGRPVTKNERERILGYRRGGV